MQLLLNFDERLAQDVRTSPEALLPVLESATKKVYHNNYHDYHANLMLYDVRRLQL